MLIKINDTLPIAHLKLTEDPNHIEVNSLKDHLLEVAKQAFKYATAFNAENLAYTIGLFHDLGKYSPNFQFRIRKENGINSSAEPPEDNTRDHSTAGAVHAFKNTSIKIQDKYAIGMCVLCHHTGLKNAAEVFDRRIKSLNGEKKYEEASPFNQWSVIKDHKHENMLEGANELTVDFNIRFLFSTLVDADWGNAEAFYNPDKSKLRGHSYTMEGLLKTLQDYMQGFSKNVKDTVVNKTRATILNDCWAAADKEPGAFSLTVPTGGGKTLCSLAFALKHAVKNNLNRVIIVVPFNSIIEQIAQVYKNIFGNDAVLEHHSSFDPKNETVKTKLASENWDAPIIVTTNVQFLESLFSNKTHTLRKIHRMTQSVIIFDEAQSLPVNYLDPIMDMLNSLIKIGKSSIVISTATQPSLKKSDFCKFGFDNSTEIISNVQEHFSTLKRVKVTFPDLNKEITYSELAQSIAPHKDVLAIVHLRKDAIELARHLDALEVKNVKHLSGSMCGKHRSEVIGEIKRSKLEGNPCVLVSTQLIEAGVDLDFVRVYRSLGGVDSMAQAAGRCNREGKLEAGEFIMFLPTTLPPLGTPQDGLNIIKEMIRRDANLDLFDQLTYDIYFSKFYKNKNTDIEEIQSAPNNKPGHRNRLAFETVADKFKIIDQNYAAPLIVRYNNESLIEELISDPDPSRFLCRKLQQYTVNVSKSNLDKWIQKGFVIQYGSMNVLTEDMAKAYDHRFGFDPEKMIRENEITT